MKVPKWVEIGIKDIGMAEIPGSKTAPRITQWLKRLKAWWTDDETPWCGVAVAGWLSEAGYVPPKDYYRAKAYLTWGQVLPAPAYGCIVVFSRTGGGHVGICVGIDNQNRLMVLGGNQGNRVSVMAFDQNRVEGYRWPSEEPFIFQKLPLISAKSELSTNEA